jgi:ribonucleoside-diphosphate reductase alpha chain
MFIEEGTGNHMYQKETIFKLNQDITTHFTHIFPIEPSFSLTHAGVSRLVMLDRYSQKDRSLKTLGVNDLVVTIVKEDPKFPARGIGIITKMDKEKEEVTIKLDEEFRAILEDEKEAETGLIVRPFKRVEKPLEIYYEQIAKRVGKSLASTEQTPELKEKFSASFADELAKMNIIPAGRVLYGAGSGTQVTYFNCFVMPFIHDSRGGISSHRAEVMEIMSRGGGVGTNGSTLRPKSAPAKGVGGKSSGAVSWLNDIANLTHLVEQGGSRRGAQMIMLADWHPDIIEFIVSKMQNAKVLKWLTENSKDYQIVEEAKRKLKFVPLTRVERELYEAVVDSKNAAPQVVEYAREMLIDGGKLEDHAQEFLSGANISVTFTK